MSLVLIQGDSRHLPLADGSVACVVSHSAVNDGAFRSPPGSRPMQDGPRDHGAYLRMPQYLSRREPNVSYAGWVLEPAASKTICQRARAVGSPRRVSWLLQQVYLVFCTLYQGNVGCAQRELALRANMLCLPGLNAGASRTTLVMTTRPGLRLHSRGYFRADEPVLCYDA
jgi:hypothetical protein